MVSREDRAAFIGICVFIAIEIIMNLMMNIDLATSSIMAALFGIISGLLAFKLLQKSTEREKYVDLMLKIVAWGLMSYVIIVLILKWFGAIASPTFDAIIGTWLIGLSGEVIRLEIKLVRLGTEIKLKIDMLWNEFRKRKKI